MARIHRPTVLLVRNLVLLGLVVAGAPTGYRKLRVYLGQDAFADLKKPNSTEPVGIRLEEARFRHFHGTTLLTSASADRIEVSRDRRKLEMFGIHDGFYRDGDRKFRYRANTANWDANRRILKVGGGVRVSNADLNLRAEGALFDSRKSRLVAAGHIKGMLAKGSFDGQNLVYNTETEAFRLGPVSWTGKIPAKMIQDAPEEVKSRTWNFKAEETKHIPGKKGEPRMMRHKNAIATDGEVIVIAANIDHNRDTDEIIATGDEKQPRVQYFSAKSNMIASRVQVFRKEKRAVFTGNVIMLVKPKKDQSEKPKVEALPAFQPLLPDQVKAEPGRFKGKPEEEGQKKGDDLRSTKNIRDFPLVMASAKIEYWYARGSRRAVITGDPQGRQELPDSEWRHLWSNVGYYDGEKELLKLVSTQGRKDTRMKNSIGDDVVATWLLMSTNEEDESFTGAQIEGDFADLGGNDDPRNDPKKPVTPPPGTNPPPGGGPGTTGGGNGGGLLNGRTRRI